MFDPKDSKTIGHHVFFLPPNNARESLQEIITSLAHAYDSIPFEPHITLLARIEHSNEEYLKKQAAKMAQTMQPFTVVLDTLAFEDVYYRALYYKVRNREPLAAYHKTAATIFGMSENPQYMPHLSLFYGNISEEKKKEMMENTALPERIEFVVDTLYLYRTSGEAHQWRRVGEYPLV